MADFDGIDWRKNIASRAVGVNNRLERVREGSASKTARSKTTYAASVQGCSDDAVSLLAECIENQVVPPEQLLELFASLLISDTRFDEHDQKTLANAGIGTVGKGIWAALNLRRVASFLGVNTAQLPKFFIAAECEAGYPPDPTERDPSIAPIATVAKAASVDRKTIKSWRKLDSYREKVTYRRKVPKTIYVE